MVNIYGLYSTKNPDLIRYVGKTKYHLKKRLTEHVNGAVKRNGTTHKDKWIRKEISNGNKIGIKLLEEVDDNEWEDAEKRHIKEVENLTNITEGGESGHGIKYTLSYEDAKKWLMVNLSISSIREFRENTQNLPDFFPKNPKEHFKITGEWKNWGDFLGTNRIQDNKKAENYLSYSKARRWLKINSPKIKSSTEYKTFVSAKKISFLPTRPDRYYANKGWLGWGDFLDVKKRYEINTELLGRYFNRFFPKITGIWTFEKNHDKVCKAIKSSHAAKINWIHLKHRKNCPYELFIRYCKIHLKGIVRLKDYQELVRGGKRSKNLPIQPSVKYNKKWEDIINDVTK